MSLFSHAFTLDLAASRTGHEADIGITIKDKTLTDRGRFTGFAETDVAGQFEAVIENLDTDWLPFSYQVDDDGEVVSTLGSRVVNWADIEPADSFTDDDREDIAAIKAKTDTIGEGRITVQGIVLEPDEVTYVYRGDDYTGVRAISCVLEGPAIEAIRDQEVTAEFIVVRDDWLDPNAELTPEWTESGLSLPIELTSAQTSKLTNDPTKPMDWWIRLTLEDALQGTYGRGQIVGLASGVG
jgi:hypothetical protein